MRVGSEEHKELFCRSFIDSHERYEPEALPWPQLDEKSLGLLRSMPIWNMALQVEVNAGATLEHFARSQRDPLIIQALRLQGYEEDRHGRMLAVLSDRYGLNVTSEPAAMPIPRILAGFRVNAHPLPEGAIVTRTRHSLTVPLT